MTNISQAIQITPIFSLFQLLHNNRFVENAVNNLTNTIMLGEYMHTISIYDDTNIISGLSNMDKTTPEFKQEFLTK